MQNSANGIQFRGAPTREERKISIFMTNGGAGRKSCRVASSLTVRVDVDPYRFGVSWMWREGARCGRSSSCGSSLW